MKAELINVAFPFKGADSYHGALGTERSRDRLHVSDIITRLGIASGNMKDYSTSGESGFESAPTQELGFCWEDVLTSMVGNRCGERLGEVERDGIVGSPDGLGADVLDDDHPDCQTLVAHEYKCTWKSLATLEPEMIAGGGPKSWYYMAQAKSYCAILGVNTMVFWVLYVHGDYRQIRCAARCYRIQWEQWEIEEHWRDVTNFAKTIKAES